MPKLYRVAGKHPKTGRLGCGCKLCKDEEYYIKVFNGEEMIAMCKNCVRIAEGISIDMNDSTQVNDKLHIMETINVETISKWKP